MLEAARLQIVAMIKSTTFLRSDLDDASSLKHVVTVFANSLCHMAEGPGAAAQLLEVLVRSIHHLSSFVQGSPAIEHASCSNKPEIRAGKACQAGL
jgi:hypothetical protein